jgi:hypothetical protein
MPPFLKTYGDTEGPLGLPMKDKQARAVEAILSGLPSEERVLQRRALAKAPAEVLSGERSDVSWITTESIDRDREIVCARGMNDAQFAANPLVTMQHAYHEPPVGRSLWRKRSRDGAVGGIKAKTLYPPRPADWAEPVWPPDAAFQLIQAGLLQGKSIGFLVLKSHSPSSHEIAALPDLANVQRIIDEWLLLEYACTFLPTNQGALVEAVSKSRVAVPKAWLPEFAPPPPLIPFIAADQIEAAIQRRLEKAFPVPALGRLVQDACARAQGRV